MAVRNGDVAPIDSVGCTSPGGGDPIGTYMGLNPGHDGVCGNVAAADPLVAVASLPRRRINSAQGSLASPLVIGKKPFMSCGFDD